MGCQSALLARGIDLDGRLLGPFHTPPTMRPFHLPRCARLALAAVISFLALFSATPCAAQEFEGKTITSIAIQYRGARTVDEARLRNFMSVKPGQAYSAEALDKDIRSLYESGLVDDVRFLAEADAAGVKLIAEVATRPPLDAIGFLGSTAFKDEKLARESGLTAGSSLSDAEILTARRKIEAFYQAEGFPDVVVSHRLQPGEGGGAALIFVIEEGGKNLVRNINFEGNTVFSDKTLRKEMKTEEKGIFSFVTKSGRFEAGQLDEDLEAVLDYYRNKGYLRVSSPGVLRTPVGDGRVDLTISLNEGEKYTVAGIGLGTMSVFRPEEIMPSLTLVAGDAYSAAKMREDITTIRSFYGSRGYADAQVLPDISNAGPTSVNIVYRITEGSRYRVGLVNIEGNTKTQPKVIRREVPLNPGDYFNSVELPTTKKRLENMNYFSDVQVSATPSSRAGYRDLNVLVEEKRTGSISFGLGFSSIDNIVGYINLEQTNFDIRNPWSFTGAGQRFAASVRAGSETQNFEVSLTEPWFLGQRLALGGRLFYQSAQYFSDVFDQTNMGGAVFLRKAVGRYAYIRGEYTLENIEVNLEPIAQAPSEFAQDGGEFIRSSLGVNYVYDSRDSNILPRKGHKIDAGVKMSGGILGGDVDTYTLSLSGTKHWEMWGDTILTLTGEATTVDAINGRVPVFERQFLGGARTLRGFEFRDVGPRDATTGEVLGGQSMAFASVEYTVPIVERVRAAAFYDLGMVNAAAWDFGVSDYYSDAGLGLRLNLPFGPLALDYAIPIESPDPLADKGGQFNFYLNYQF